MASRRRVKITNKPAPRIAAGVDRGGRSARINPNQIAEDREAIRRRQGGFSQEGQWRAPNQGALPRSYSEDYLAQEGRAINEAVYRGGYYNNPGLNTFPYHEPVRDTNEGDRFSQEDFAQGDFIPFTYEPTKTSWPANGWDHRRTVAAGYSASQGILRVQFFTDGAVYDYGTEHRIPPEVAKAFRLTQSPGRYINNVLEHYGYLRVN